MHFYIFFISFLLWQLNFIDKPRIDVGAVKDITVKAGEEFSITVPFTGFPKPDATWTKNDKDIDSKDTRLFLKVIL